jgi:hypothetical protein
MSDEETVVVPLIVYKRLMDNEKFLNALEAAGVDNWSGYVYAQDIYEGKYD